MLNRELHREQSHVIKTFLVVRMRKFNGHSSSNQNRRIFFLDNKTTKFSQMAAEKGPNPSWMGKETAETAGRNYLDMVENFIHSVSSILTTFFIIPLTIFISDDFRIQFIQQK